MAATRESMFPTPSQRKLYTILDTLFPLHIRKEFMQFVDQIPSRIVSLDHLNTFNQTVVDFINQLSNEKSENNLIAMPFTDPIDPRKDIFILSTRDRNLYKTKFSQYKNDTSFNLSHNQYEVLKNELTFNIYYFRFKITSNTIHCSYQEFNDKVSINFNLDLNSAYQFRFYSTYIELEYFIYRLRDPTDVTLNVHKPTTKTQIAKTNDLCAVCLEPIRMKYDEQCYQGTFLCAISPEGVALNQPSDRHRHILHPECVEQCAEFNRKCPLCRAPIELDDNVKRQDTIKAQPFLDTLNIKHHIKDICRQDIQIYNDERYVDLMYRHRYSQKYDVYSTESKKTQTMSEYTDSVASTNKRQRPMDDDDDDEVQSGPQRPHGPQRPQTRSQTRLQRPRLAQSFVRTLQPLRSIESMLKCMRISVNKT